MSVSSYTLDLAVCSHLSFNLPVLVKAAVATPFQWDSMST